MILGFIDMLFRATIHYAPPGFNSFCYFLPTEFIFSLNKYCYTTEDSCINFISIITYFPYLQTMNLFLSC